MRSNNNQNAAIMSINNLSSPLAQQLSSSRSSSSAMNPFTHHQHTHTHHQQHRTRSTWLCSFVVIVALVLGHGVSPVEALPPWATSLVQLGSQWDQVSNQFALNCDTSISLEQTLFPTRRTLSSRTLPGSSTTSGTRAPGSRVDYVTRLSLKELELHLKRKETQYFASAVEEIFYSSILRLADDAYQLENNLNETVSSRDISPTARWRHHLIRDGFIEC